MTRRIFTLRMFCNYNYGGDTGPGTLFDKTTTEPVDYDELLRQIDAFADELKSAVKHMKP